MRRNRSYFEGNRFIYVLFISYFIFLVTSGIGNLHYNEKRELTFVKNKFDEIQEKYEYLMGNMSHGNIEDNNKEILYLEEMRDEILDSVSKEGEFWLVDLKNLIKQKENLLIRNFIDNNINQDDITYLKLKNELDEYNLYYSLKEKPLEYTDSLFIRNFIYIFNSKGHQIFLTCVVFLACFYTMKFKGREYSGFFNISISLVIGVIIVQILNLLIWFFNDNGINLFYPIRIIDNFNNNFNVESIADRVVPFYQIVLYIFLSEIIYIMFIVSSLKIIDLLFEKGIFKVLGLFIFVLLTIGLSFTPYRGISFFSYGKFFDVIRGYEGIYRANEIFGIQLFLVILCFSIGIFSFVYLYKKYILNNGSI